MAPVADPTSQSSYLPSAHEGPQPQHVAAPLAKQVAQALAGAIDGEADADVIGATRAPATNQEAPSPDETGNLAERIEGDLLSYPDRKHSGAAEARSSQQSNRAGQGFG